jgi:carbon monoxide dehydrogenase subunit G
MSEVVLSIEIAATPQQVWDVVMDPYRFGEWVTIHKKLNSASDGPVATGSEMEQTMVLRGAPFKVSWKLVTCTPPNHAVWHGRGPARSHAETEYRLTPIDGGTRFAYRNDFRAPMGPLGAAASKALVGALPEREARATLKRLKALLEGSSGS